MPSDGSNRASEGEQLWSPDPPTPSAGEVFSTIPATRMATDNQLLKFANPQVVWYTSAITTIVHTFDYLQRLQRGMVESICKKKSQRQQPCYFTDMNINCFLSTNPERNLAKVPRNLEGNFFRWYSQYQAIERPGKPASAATSSSKNNTVSRGVLKYTH